MLGFPLNSAAAAVPSHVDLIPHGAGYAVTIFGKVGPYKDIQLLAAWPSISANFPTVRGGVKNVEFVEFLRNSRSLADVNGDAVVDILHSDVEPKCKAHIMYKGSEVRIIHAYFGDPVSTSKNLTGHGVSDPLWGICRATETPDGSGTVVARAGAAWMLPGPLILPTKTPTTTPSHFLAHDFSSQPLTDSSANQDPSVTPSAAPSTTPSSDPSANPSQDPSMTPNAAPSTVPSADPSSGPSQGPSVTLSAAPSTTPSADPSASPSQDPSKTPTSVPITNPTVFLPQLPFSGLSLNPTVDPTAVLSVVATVRPSARPIQGQIMKHCVAPEHTTYTSQRLVLSTSNFTAFASPQVTSAAVQRGASKQFTGVQIAIVVIGVVVGLVLLLVALVFFAFSQDQTPPILITQVERQLDTVT